MVPVTGFELSKSFLETRLRQGEYQRVMNTPNDPNDGKGGETSAQKIAASIQGMGDWRGETLARIRALIKQADPDVIEEVKWIKPSNPDGVPVWSQAGILCTGETYKDKVKLTFAKGASLADPAGLFNASLEGDTRRAIDLREGDQLDDGAFIELFLAAVTLNISSTR